MDADGLVMIQVGNEFGAVEALWSQFEGVMAKEGGEGEVDAKEEGERKEGEGDRLDEGDEEGR